MKAGPGARGRAAAALAALALTVAGPARLAAQKPDADSVLDRAVAALRQVTTLRAAFTQRIQDPMVGGDDTSSGELLLKRPDKFAMRWEVPKGDLILQDGQALWVYLPSTAPRQVVRTTLTGRPGESMNFVEEFLDRPRERFTYSYVRADSVGSRLADVLALVPRQANAGYQRVLLWVDREDGLTRRFEVNEGSGAVRRITLDHIRVNVTIPASSFVFKVPNGVRVIDGSE